MVNNYPPQPCYKLIVKYLTGGYSILYFLFVLIQLKALTPWLIRRITKEGYNLKKDWLWLVTPVYILIFSFIRLYRGDGFERINDIIAFDCFFPSWFIYYYMGIYLKFNKLKVLPVYLSLSVFISLYISILTAFWLCDSTSIYNFPYTQSKLTSMLLAISVILLLFSLRDDNINRNFVARIGEMSFGIYLIHMPIKITLEKLPFLSGISIIQLPLVKFILVLLLTIAILQIAYKLLPLKYVRYLGLQ